jgi:preprotein translocase subunit SecB
MDENIQGNNEPTFNVEKIYVKDMSLEIPHAPQIFLERDTPQVEVQLHTQAISLDKNLFEVVVRATVTAKVGEQVMFLIEAKQAGIFRLSNVPDKEMEAVLAVMCPNILFPYLREVVSDMSVRAGFAPTLLTPVNFESLYLQQKQATQMAASTTTH